MPSCWSQYHGLFDEVVADPSRLVASDDVWNIFDAVPTLGSSGTPHARLTIAGADCAQWLVSPAVKLDDNSALSFDLAFTAYNGQQNVQTLGQKDDRFIVAISTDEGRTWKAEDATIWNNASDVNYRLNLIGNHSHRYEVDLSKYTGKTVRVAFYGESTIEFETNDMHLDSVRIDCRNVKQVQDKTCQGYSYYANGFEIEKANLAVAGVYTFARVEHATIEGECDETILLTLTVNESKVYEYSAITCSNEPYSDQNFKDLAETGTYERAFPTPTGCDSTVILNLSVNQAYELTRELELDADELPYQYECQFFPAGTASGDYEINCTTVEGCDSIIHLSLTINGGVSIRDVESKEDVTLTPNPVRRGDFVTVDYDFTFDDINGIQIQVFNSVGQMVATSAPQGKPVAFQAPHVAGVYTVRIITASDRILIGRFIVR